MLPTFVFISLCIATIHTSSVTHAVTSYTCDRTFRISDTSGTLFTYNGDELQSGCTFIVKLNDSVNTLSSDLCITAIRYDTTCKIDVRYHFGFVNRSADGQASCSTAEPLAERCTSLSSIHVEFLSSNINPSSELRGGEIELKAYIKRDDDLIDDYDTTGGVVIGAIFISSIVLGFSSLCVIMICCRMRIRGAPGMVINQGQPMQTTVLNQTQYPAGGTGYPTQQAFPQQQQPQYYPSAGNQPAGFGLPMAGFSTTPAGSYGAGFQPEAGFQPPPSYESLMDKNASAPPLSNTATN